MKTNNLLAAALLAVSAACSPAPGPIYIQQFIGFDTQGTGGCTLQMNDTVFVQAARLDIGPGLPRLRLGVQLRSSDPLTERFIVREAELTYRLITTRTTEVMLPDGGTASTGPAPLFAQLRETLPFNATGGPIDPAPAVANVRAFAELIGPQAADLLQTVFPQPIAGDPRDEVLGTLVSSLELRGVMAQSGFTFSTGRAAFPITIYRTAVPPCATYATDVCDQYPGVGGPCPVNPVFPDRCSCEP